MATPIAYGSSWARDWIWVQVHLYHICRNAISFNPLAQAGDQTWASMKTWGLAVRFLTHCATAGTSWVIIPLIWLNYLVSGYILPWSFIFFEVVKWLKTEGKKEWREVDNIPVTNTSLFNFTPAILSLHHIVSFSLAGSASIHGSFVFALDFWFTLYMKSLPISLLINNFCWLYLENRHGLYVEATIEIPAGKINITTWVRTVGLSGLLCLYHESVLKRRPILYLSFLPHQARNEP